MRYLNEDEIYRVDIAMRYLDTVDIAMRYLDTREIYLVRQGFSRAARIMNNKENCPSGCCAALVQAAMSESYKWSYLADVRSRLFCKMFSRRNKAYWFNKGRPQGSWSCTDEENDAACEERTYALLLAAEAFETFLGTDERGKVR